MILLALLACSKTPELPTDQLPACWDSPNCVSTQAPETDEQHHIAPIPRPEGLDLAAAEQVVVGLEGCVVESKGDTWIRAACTTPSGLFTDDLDVWLEDDVVHARSSSRLGYDDLGVNRERVETLFAALQAPR